MTLQASRLAALALLMALAMRVVSTPTANLSYLIIAVYALLGRAQAIQALALSWLFTMLSPGIGPGVAAAGRYAVMAAAAASVLLRSDLFRGGSKLDRPVLATVL